MKKLISNKAAKRIIEKHTQQEIDNGIITLKRGNKEEFYFLLEQKLLEEVNEYIYESVSNKESELQDIINVCLALQGKSNKFSEGWILENTK